MDKSEIVQSATWLVALIASMGVAIVMLVAMAIAIVSRLGQEYTYIIFAVIIFHDFLWLALGFVGNRAVYSDTKAIEYSDISYGRAYIQKVAKDWVALFAIGALMSLFFLVVITGVLIAALGPWFGMSICIGTMISGISFVIVGVLMNKLFLNVKTQKANV